ncbi:MAG: hypothetical protein ACK6A9_04270 [Dolichospermum sp.]|jgi:hypothetical protein
MKQLFILGFSLVTLTVNQLSVLAQTSVLSVTTLDNTTYRYNHDLPEGPVSVTLKNGEYENKRAFSFVMRQNLPIGRGDINGDGIQDAVVVLRSGTYRYRYAGLYIAIVLNKRGQAYNVDTIEVGADKEDVLNIIVRRGVVQVTLRTLQGSDPACCPTGKVVKYYRYVNNKLSPRSTNR